MATARTLAEIREKATMWQRLWNTWHGPALDEATEAERAAAEDRLQQLLSRVDEELAGWQAERDKADRA